MMMLMLIRSPFSFVYFCSNFAKVCWDIYNIVLYTLVEWCVLFSSAINQSGSVDLLCTFRRSSHLISYLIPQYV